MRKRIVAMILAVMMLVSSALATSAPRASEYLESYIVQMVVNGGTSMTVSYGVYGTGRMAKLGADKIVIEERLNNGRWAVVQTNYGSEDPDKFYSTNSYSHDGTVSFRGMPGISYRATLTAYAANSSGSDTGSLISPVQVCK